MLYTLITCGIYAVLPYNIIAYMCSKTQLGQKRAAHMQSIVQEYRVHSRILTNNQSYMAPIGTCSASSPTHGDSLVGQSMSYGSCAYA